MKLAVLRTIEIHRLFAPKFCFEKPRTLSCKVEQVVDKKLF